MPRVEHHKVVESSRRMEPIKRSTHGFCQGDLGAVSTSVMPSPATRWRKASRHSIAIPKQVPRAVSHGNASTI